MNNMGGEAAVWASLDDALGDLLRAAVETPAEPYAETCSRIDAVFDNRMVPHRHLAWALAEADVLRRQLKAGLGGQALDPVGEAYSVGHMEVGELNL